LNDDIVPCGFVARYLTLSSVSVSATEPRWNLLSITNVLFHNPAKFSVQIYNAVSQFNNVAKSTTSSKFHSHVYMCHTYVLINYSMFTRAVLSPENHAKPCKFRYVKPARNFVRNISYDTTSPANPDEYRHKIYNARNHRPWATSLPLTACTHIRVKFNTIMP